MHQYNLPHSWSKLPPAWNLFFRGSKEMAELQSRMRDPGAALEIWARHEGSTQPAQLGILLFDTW